MPKTRYLKSAPKDDKARLLIIFIGICALFLVVLIKLYTLQIIQGDVLKNEVLGAISKPITVEAPRGSIYDKFGRPLAVNQSSFTVNIDPSVTVEHINEVILKVMNILEANGEKIVDEFPISPEKPYTFLFNGSPSLEKTWKRDMNLEDNDMGLEIDEITAEQAFLILRDKFAIDPSLSDEQARKILIVRSELWKKRFSKFIPLTLSYDVSEKTIANIEEHSDEFPNVYVDVEAKRVYPQGESFAQILGHIRAINPEEFEAFEEQGFTNYTLNDLVGKEGLEKSFEINLKGTNGVAYYEVDSLGRRIKEIKEFAQPSVAGHDVFTTLDANLNQVTYEAIETTLRDVIVNRLLGRNTQGPNLSSKQIYASMAKAGTLDTKEVLKAKSGSSLVLKNYILAKDKEAESDIEKAREILYEGVMDEKITQRDILLALYEEGVLKDNEDNSEVARIKSGNLTSLQVLINKLNTLEITPHMTGMLPAPASASVIVTDIETGDVLSSVSYPSYDNNRFVNNFDNAYYTKLNTDPTSPMINRTFTEPRAPGSIFKMIVAVAGLETNTITQNSTIYDNDIYKDAGRPYPQCWIHGSHGNVDIRKSLEVSCNYFYYSISQDMGIDTLNEYMQAFGLNDRSGVEIYELYDSSALKDYPSKMASPEYKEYIVSARNPEASNFDLKWNAGDTVRLAIGQSYNNYTAAILNKYMATIANGGERYSLHFMDKITDNKGEILDVYTPNLEHTVGIQKQNLQAVKEGMLLVTEGEKGTLRNAFRDFPVQIAAKSGTAQESEKYNDHNVFSGFAPYEDPQIAITVFIPYGTDSLSAAPEITKKILEEYLAINKEPEKKYNNSLTK